MGSFYRRIEDSFGRYVVKDMKAYSNTNRILASQKNRLIFLHECRRLNLTPRFLEDNKKKFWRIPDRITEHNINQIDFLTQQVTNKLRKISISDTKRYIEKMESRSSLLLQKLENTLPFHIFDDFVFLQHLRYKNLFRKIKGKNIQKIQQLKANCADYFSDNEKWFNNLSDTHIPQHIKGFLALGPKFSLPLSNKDINIYKLLSEVEQLIHYLPVQEQDLTRSRATNLITNYVHANTNIVSPTYQIERETRVFLRDNPNLIITRSDKGNVTVALSRTSYLEKSYDLLNDNITYESINHDPTTKIENSCNKLIGSLKSGGFLDEVTAKSLITYNGVCPKYYGLPKVHKRDVPLRPIVSCTGATTQPLSKFIGSILEISFSAFNKFRIKNTFEFAEKINNLTVPDGFVLASFDVVSLFTNISLDLVLKILDEHFNLIEEDCIIPKNKFLDVVKYLYNNTYFSFDDKFYRQKTGLPMGGAASPIIAEIVMNKLLYYVVEKVDFEFPFIFQYVDDLILSIPDGEIQNTLSIFNSFDKNLVFTVEEEKDNSVPFLDTLVVRSANNIIKLDWYRKTASSGRYIPFNSYHPLKQKINTIIALKHRITKICHPSFKEKNVELLKKILMENNYPVAILRKILNNNDRPPIHRDRVNAEDVDLKYGKLQYIKGLSEPISALFKNSNIKIANYNAKKLNLFYSNTKDETDRLKKSNVVYGIKCECGQIYIGQTSQKFSKRIALHKSDCKNRPNSTSLSSHVNKKDHRVQYQDSFILDYENNTFRRNFLEMCYIKNCKNSVNQKKDVEGLSSIYTYLLSQKFTKVMKINEAYIKNN